MSQSQNPPAEPDDDASGSFSIRQYVKLNREKYNGMLNWPFGEKSSQMLLKNGLTPNDVLPPMELPNTSQILHIRNDPVNEADESDEGLNNNVTNNSRDPSSQHEEGNQQNINIFENLLLSNPQSEEGASTLPSSSNVVVHQKRKKRGRGRPKNKKRSMVDIMAEAKHRTIEEVEIYKMDNSCYPILIDSSDEDA